MTSPQDPFGPPSDQPGGQSSGQPAGGPPPGWGPPPQAGGPGYGPPPQGYGQDPGQFGQPYGQSGGYGQQPPKPGTNGLAIASLITAFLCSPLGIALGFVAKNQISKTGQAGNGLATAGIVVGVVGILLNVLLFTSGAFGG